MYSPAIRNLLFKNSGLMGKNIVKVQGCLYHSVAKDPTKAIGGEKGVQVYTAPEFE